MREMKDSGVPWIGEIPKGWKLLRNKNAFLCSKEIVGSKSMTAQLLSLTTKGIKEKGPEVVGGKVPESFDTYQTVRKGQLVMCLFDLDCSAVFSGLSPYDGMISPAYRVLDCKADMDPSFASHWFCSVFDGRKFMHYSKNLRYTLTYDEFAVLPIVIPPIQEQHRIADFLDAKCAEIDTILEKTRTSIEDYKKLKLSVITEAVTKGILGNRQMKESGVEWIGKIPEGWRCCKLKQACSKISDGSHFSPEISTEGYPYITAKDVHGLGIDYTSASKISEENYFALVKAGCKPERNDVLLVKDGATTGRVGMVTDNTACVLLSSVAMLHHNSQVSPTYLYYFLQSNVMQEQIVISMAGSAMPRITLSKIVGFVLTIPPISEQKEVTAYLDEKCAAIDSLIASKEALITELETYKKSLIYEYVTGKKEVL